MTTQQTILVVEDDAAMRDGLKDNLEIEGYQVLTAATIRHAKELALQEKYDLVLLDVMLPDGDGISLCRYLRAQNIRQPVIMLTARGEEIDKILGFEVGADDYVVKPFGLRELLARIQARLRRPGTGAAKQEMIPVGVASANFERHLLLRDGIKQEISTKEMELLQYLVIHRGKVLSREKLLTEVWGHQRDIATRTVDNFIVKLRKKIEGNPAEPHYLITIHGSGYKLVEQ